MITNPDSPKPELPDIQEYGAPDKKGKRAVSDKRLFMQLVAFTGCLDPGKCAQALERSGLESVLYFDINDARGIAVLFMSEEASLFTGKVRSLLTQQPFSQLTPRPEFTMFGRSYSTGFEQDLEDWLIRKPRRNVFNSKLNWAVWYPLRRKGEFELVPKEDLKEIMSEHAKLGMGYGAAELVNDVRLACHGLGTNDNEFILGLVGKDLFPLSRLVQDMRKTKQTSKYIESMGPFFVGQVFWRSKNS